MRKLYTLLLIALSAALFVQFAAPKDGLAQGAERNVLLEVFTSTTCPPCAPQNNAFMNWLNNSPNADRVSVIKYPVSWPGNGCVFYHQNPAPVNLRRSYYSVNAAPTGVVDGSPLGSSASTWTNRIQNNFSNPAEVSLSLGAAHDGEGNLAVTATVTRPEGTDYPSGMVRLRVAIVEREIQYNAPNGSTVQTFVHRDMLPGGNGIEITLSEGQTENYQFSGELDSSWDLSELEVVAFVQEQTGQRRVLQSQIAEIIEGDVIIIGTPVLVSPSNGEELVSFDQTEFEWQAASNAELHDLQISESQNFNTTVVLENGLGGTSFSTSVLEPETTYYWRARGSADGVSGDWSSTSSFTTVMAPPDQEPQLLQPSDGAVIGSESVSLIWQSISEAETYQIRFADDSSFSDPIHDVSGLDQTSYQVTNLEPEAVYYWKVRGENPGGTGDWSVIYSFEMQPATSVGPGEELPTVVALHQNYPNPFNPDTRISFELPESSDVRLSVYTLEGRLVSVLAAGRKAAGVHSLSFGAENLSSGVYIYRLEAGGEVLTRKMMLVK